MEERIVKEERIPVVERVERTVENVPVGDRYERVVERVPRYEVSDMGGGSRYLARSANHYSPNRNDTYSRIVYKGGDENRRTTSAEQNNI